MNSKTLIRRAVSFCLMIAVYATYSTIALASTEKIAGELLISGKNSSVKVNGEMAQSGRSIFSASTISTPENTSAIINLGKAGRIQLEPNSSANISFTEKSISGDLLSGKITILAASQSVSIKTAEGKTVVLGAGESINAMPLDDDYRDGNGNCIDADKDGKLECSATTSGGLPWWGWAAIFGGAIGVTVAAATTNNNDIALGGGTIVTSTSR